MIETAWVLDGIAPTAPMSNKRRAAIRARTSHLLNSDERVEGTFDADVILRAFDGYAYWHAYGLVTVTTKRALFVKGPHSPRFTIEHADAIPISGLGDGQRLMVEDWLSLHERGPACLMIGTVDIS